MSEVNAEDLTEINSADDVFSLYSGSGGQAKSGLEVELAFFNPEDPDLSVMSLCQNRILKNSAMAILPSGDWVHNEPTSELLEVSSKAGSFAEAKDVLKDCNDKIKVLSDKALSIGLKRSYFQELPDKIADDLLSRIVDLDRYRVMYAPYRADMRKCVQYFAVSKSNQVSVSPYNMDHMLENVRRLYMLAPFLFLLTDNSTGFIEGQPFSGHSGMDLRYHGLTEGRGGILPYAFTAKTGEEFVAKHINYAMNNPLFMHYDAHGNLVGVPSGDWSVTFNTLKERGLNTSSNYYLAQSLLWPDVKIAALKDGEGHVTGHRYEARMFGVGLHQHQTAFFITSALAFHEGCASHIDELLWSYGFTDENLHGSYDLLQKSYRAAREHNGNFFNVAYGSGTMAAFARDFADVIEDVADDVDMLEEVQPLLTICRTGCTDGKVNRVLFPTLEDVVKFQKTYDTSVFDNPNICARTLFEKKLAGKIQDACGSGIVV